MSDIGQLARSTDLARDMWLLWRLPNIAGAPIGLGHRVPVRTRLVLQGVLKDLGNGRMWAISS